MFRNPRESCIAMLIVASWAAGWGAMIWGNDGSRACLAAREEEDA